MNIFMLPLSMLGCAIASIVILSIALISVVRKRPRRATSVFLALMLPILLWWPINRAAEYIHLGITVGLGAGQLGAPSKSDGSGFEAYDWSVGFAGANTFLIHDVTDEIALPMVQHKHPSISENGFGEMCAARVSHLLGHYYVCNF